MLEKTRKVLNESGRKFRDIYCVKWMLERKLRYGYLIKNKKYLGKIGNLVSW